ncbi:DUF6434 domain-containing protein [Pantoea ananatis]
MRRFLVAQCGERFRFDRDFTAWIAMTFPKTWERWWMSGSAERLADTHHLLIPYPFCIRLCAGTVYVRTWCQRVKIAPSRHTRRLFYCGFTAPNLTG